MGHRRTGGGRNQSNLFRRVEEACKKGGCRTLDDAVQYLRSSFPEYSRMNQQVLMSSARRAFQELQSMLVSSRKSPSHTKGSGNTEPEIGSSNQKIKVFEEDEEGANDSWRASPSHSRRRKKRIDRGEEKLLRLEEEHLKRLRKMEAESESETGLEDDVSTTSSSEDAVDGLKFEPDSDFMKSMLRKGYGGSKTESSKGEERNLEVEDVSMEKRLAVLAEVGTGPKGLTPGTGRNKGEKKGSKRSVPAAEEEVIPKASGPTFRDLGGMTSVLEELTMEVIVPLYHPQLSIWLGVRSMGGILLHGPPGCGKTKLAHAIANETGVPFYKISATEVVSGVSGSSEENIRELFLKAVKTAPSIVFIDEIDAIASKRENLQREMERRIVTQLMICMDESHRHLPSEKNSEAEDDQPKPVGNILVIGATNRPDAVDPALRRPGRFDREIALGVPDESARLEILSVLTRNLRLEGDFDMAKIARVTPGFVGADLSAVTNKAGNLAMKRILDRRKSELSRESIDAEPVEEWWRKPWLPEDMQDLSITMADFEEATKLVQPSLKREGFSEIPNVKWEDVGGLDTLRQEFERFIVRRIKFPEIYEECGVDMETGFLLYGPPGCGKTLIAKAVANEAGASFIHIKGPEILNKWVGESESAVRSLFRRARTCAPCILFFDEVDAITKRRDREGGLVVERLLTQLLIELDGGEKRKGVYVIGATNRRDAMDEATLRPGRFGKHLYVPLPSAVQRGLILQALGRKKPLDDSVDLVAIGQSNSCENLSGADLAALMNEAAMAALEERISSDVDAAAAITPFSIKAEHFEHALKKVTPSVSEKQKRSYDRSSVSFKAA